MPKVNKGLITLVVATALSVSYLGYDIWAEKKDNQKKETEARLLDGKIEDINKFRLKILSTNLEIEVSRSEGTDGWRLQRPIQDSANEVSVREFLDGILKEKSLSQLLAVDEKSLGFDQPLGEVIIFRNNEGLKFIIGSQKNFEGNTYIKRVKNSANGSEEVRYFLADASWMAKMQKSVLDFRDRRLARQPMAAVDWLQVQRGGSFTELVRKDNQWILSQKPEWSVDQNKVRETLGMLNTNQVLDFVNELPKDAKEIGVLSLKSPEWKGKFFQTLDKNGVRKSYLQASGFTMMINNSDADRALVISMADWRDRKVPFKFNRSDVDKIKLSSQLGRFEFKRKSDDGSEWILVTSSDPSITTDRIDSGVIRGLLSELMVLSVDQFYSMNHPDLVKTPKHEIELISEKNQSLLKLEFSDSVSKDPLTKVVYGKSSLMSEQFQILELDFVDLKLDGFLKKTETSGDENNK